MIRSECGFTVVELLVAMSLTGLVIGFSYQSYQFYQQHFVRWQQRIALETTARGLMTSMLSRIATMRTIIQAKEESLTFFNQYRKTVTYRFHHRQVYKNDQALLGTGLFVKKLQLKYFLKNGNTFTFTDDIVDIERVEVELIIQNNKHLTFEINSGVTLRNKRFF